MASCTIAADRLRLLQAVRVLPNTVAMIYTVSVKDVEGRRRRKTSAVHEFTYTFLHVGLYNLKTRKMSDMDGHELTRRGLRGRMAASMPEGCRLGDIAPRVLVNLATCHDLSHMFPFKVVTEAAWQHINDMLPRLNKKKARKSTAVDEVGPSAPKEEPIDCTMSTDEDSSDDDSDDMTTTLANIELSPVSSFAQMLMVATQARAANRMVSPKAEPTFEQIVQFPLGSRLQDVVHLASLNADTHLLTDVPTDLAGIKKWIHKLMLGVRPDRVDIDNTHGRRAVDAYQAVKEAIV